MQIPQLRAPSGQNGAAPVVAHGQAKPGPRVLTSNLDLTGMRIVKRGCVVSYHGLRCKVDRVRGGFLWGQTLDIAGRPVPSATLATECREVQVVA